MNQKEFFTRLEKALKGLSESEKNDILTDFREHMAMALEAGKTESEILEKLGDPVLIGKSYISQKWIHKAKNTDSLLQSYGGFFKSVLLFCGFGFVNLVLFGLPFLFFTILLFAFLFGSLVFFLMKCALFLFSLVMFSLGGVFVNLAGMFFSLVLLIGAFWVLKTFMHFTFAYIQKSISLIQNKEGSQ